jgi:hypothetical protein
LCSYWQTLQFFFFFFFAVSTGNGTKPASLVRQALLSLHQPFFVMVFSEIGTLEPFTLAGLKP